MSSLTQTHLIDKRTAVQSRDLTFTNVRNFQVRVEKQVEWECQLLGWIVNADVKVKLLLSQYDAICDAEAVEMINYGLRLMAINQADTHG